MKILLLVRDIDMKAGSGRNVATISAVLRGLGHEVSVLAYMKDFWRFVMEVRKRAHTSDVVQAIDINPVGLPGYLATRFTKAKFVIIAQAAYAIAPLYSRKAALPSRIVYRGADAVVAGSSFVAQEIQRKVPGLNISVIDPGIDMSKFSDVTRTDRHVSITNPYILGVGAVKARKGYDISLRAFALLKTDFPQKLGNVSYHIACHLRVQNMGQKTREMLQLVPETQVNTVERCSGHDGTPWRTGRRASSFRSMTQKRRRGPYGLFLATR